VPGGQTHELTSVAPSEDVLPFGQSGQEHCTGLSIEEEEEYVPAAQGGEQKQIVAPSDEDVPI